MVNEEHYARLKESVQAWNEWRAKDVKIIPDLSGADIRGANLSGAELGGADLRRTNLRGANLSGAELGGAELSGANLREANLSSANLSGFDLSGFDLSGAELKWANLSSANLNMANLSGANLSGTDFSGAELKWAKLKWANLSSANLSLANLSGTDFSGANLSSANLSSANLKGANLNGTDLSRANLSGIDFSGFDLSEVNLSGTDLSGTDFSGTDFSGANLSGTDLSGANLSGTDFSGTDFSGANLSSANLKGANLSKTQALGTDFTGAKFTGACLEDWNIKSATKLDNIDCQYVYLRSDKQERRPSSGDFAPGEFTKLFQKALETVDLIFADGIDWKAFLLSFQELQAEYGEENLSVQAIEKKSGGAFVIRLEVPPEANKADIERQAKELYENKLNELEARYHTELKAKDEQIAIYRQHNATLENVINILGNRPIQNIITVTAKAQSESMSESYKSKYDLSNAQVGGIVDTAQTGSHQEFNQYNYTPEQRQNLAEAAAEIQQLLYQLAQTNPTTDTVTQAIYQEIKRNPTLKARLISALKAGGMEALKAIFNHPLFSIPAETIKGWLEAE